MALKKEILQDNGVRTTYHKVTLASISTDNTESSNRLTVMLDSFLDEEYRSKNTPIMSTSYSFDVNLTEDENIGIRKLAYQKLKETKLFEGSEDC